MKARQISAELTYLVFQASMHDFSQYMCGASLQNLTYHTICTQKQFQNKSIISCNINSLLINMKIFFSFCTETWGKACGQDDGEMKTDWSRVHGIRKWTTPSTVKSTLTSHVYITNMHIKTFCGVMEVVNYNEVRIKMFHNATWISLKQTMMWILIHCK
jgi:hypothetical protein